MAFGDEVIAAARAQIGVTYAWGGGTKDGPSRGIHDGGTADKYGDYNKVGFDCSGLCLYAVYKGSGGKITLDHLADSQARGGQSIARGKEQPGDLIAFSSDGGGRYHHIGIYIGGGNLLNAPQSGKTVSVMPVSGWAGETWAVRRYGANATGKSSDGTITFGFTTKAGDSGTTTTPPPKPLPKIGPAAKHAVIPMTNAPYVDVDWNRLAEVKVHGVRGFGLNSTVTTAVTGATMSFSIGQIGQLTLQITDSLAGDLVGSGIFAKGTSIDFGDQHLDLRGIDYSPGNGGAKLTLKARSRVISVLKGPEHTGRGTWAEQDVSRWVRDRCREAGAICDVQANLGTFVFNRQESDQVESTWDVMQKAAKAVGCLCWEYEQVIVFMRPTSFHKRSRVHLWDLYWNNNTDYSKALAGMPAYTWSLDGDAEALSFDLISSDSAVARPGDIVTFKGNLGEASGKWMMTQVDLPLSGTKPVRINCARVIDPKPEPVAK